MTTAVTMTPAGVLRGAADWLAEDPSRWGRDFFIAPDTQCRCAAGAVAWVLDPSDSEGNPTELRDPEKTDLGWYALDVLANYLTYHQGAPLADDSVETVAYFNDDPDTDAVKVIAALRGAAVEWDARQAARLARAS
jgi:hypothetical protein